MRIQAKLRHFVAPVALLAAGMATTAVAQDVTLAFAGGAGPTGVPAILAMEALEAQGLSTAVIEFDSPDILTQALLNGQVQISVMGPSTAFAANAAGADLQMLAKNNQNDYLIIASPDVETCADLDGKVVAYHSTGSSTTAHLMAWLKDTCPEANPEFLVLSGSANRVAALLNGQINGTLVRLEDWMAITRGADERARVLAMLVETQRDLLTGAVVVSGSHIENNRPQIEAFLAELENQFDAIYADPEAYAARAAEHLSEMSLEDVTAVYQYFAETQMFPIDEPLTPEMVAATIKFYEDAERLEVGVVTPETVGNYTFANGN